MARKSRRDVAEDERLASAGDESLEDSGPSRTKRKKASEELQTLGERLVTLRADLCAALPLPARLREEIVEAKRITAHGGKRRQMQYIGKLMRELDVRTLEVVREALLAEQGRSAKDTATLQRAERWRDALIDDDTELERWLIEYPATDSQQLRALIRQARKDAREGVPGETKRHGRAYREIFAQVRAQLEAASREPDADP